MGPVPDCVVPDGSVQNLALILGELQTNSLKYGALSKHDRPVTITARLQDNALAVTWTEDLGRAVAPPERSGAGTKLIERLGTVSGHRADIAWVEPGLVVTFYVRAHRVTA